MITKITTTLAAVAMMAAPAFAQNSTEWTAHTSISPMDDTRSAFAAILSDSAEEALVLYCWDNGKEMISFLTDEVHSTYDGDYLQPRVDSNTPYTIRKSQTVVTGDYNTTVSFSNSHELFEQIVAEIGDGSTRIVADTSETAYTTFTLRSSKAAIAEARAFCRGEGATS